MTDIILLDESATDTILLDEGGDELLLVEDEVTPGDVVAVVIGAGVGGANCVICG